MAQTVERDSLKKLRDLIRDESTLPEETRYSLVDIDNKNRKEWDGWSPLVEAVKQGRIDILKILVEDGFNIDSIVKNQEVFEFLFTVFYRL